MQARALNLYGKAKLHLKRGGAQRMSTLVSAEFVSPFGVASVLHSWLTRIVKSRMRTTHLPDNPDQPCGRASRSQDRSQ